MKGKRYIVFAFVLFICSSVSYAAAINGFDYGSSGSMYGRIHEVPGYTTSIQIGEMAWYSTNGNPQGNIRVSVGNTSDRLYWISMTNPSGYNLATSQYLKVDMKLDGSIITPAAFTRFYINSGANYLITNDAYSFQWNGQTGWVTFSVPLIAEAFIPDPSYYNSLSFEQIIAQPTAIGIGFGTYSNYWSNLTYRGISSNDGAALSIDNFGTTVPEPSSIIVLGSLFFGLVFKRRH